MRSAHFSLWRWHSTIASRALTLALLCTFVLSPLEVYAQSANAVPAPDSSLISTVDMPISTAQEGPASLELAIPGVSANELANVATNAVPQDASLLPAAATANANPAAEKLSAFSAPDKLTAFSSEQRAEASKFDLSPASISSLATNKWLNSYEYSTHLPGLKSVSGALVYDIPIVTPPGRNGVEPNLKLTYNSQDQNNDSIFGLGWSINIPYIERINKNGVNNLYSGLAFSSSFDGELSTSTATTTSKYWARFDDGSMRQYSYSTSTQTWTMIDKAGMQYVFGSTTSSRIYNSAGDTSQIARWALQTMRDSNGNTMTYTYTKDSNQIYPSSITYTMNGTTTTPFKVEFVTQARSLTTSHYKYAFKVQTSYRISEIDVKINGTLSSKYVLAYTTGAAAARDLLQSVTQTGYDEASSPTALPAMSFTYQSMNVGWATSTTPSPFNLPALADAAGKDLGFRVFHSIRNQPSTFIHRSPFYASAYQAPGWDVIGSPTTYPTLIDDSDLDIGSAIVDVNGDGFPDIVQGKTGSYHEVYLTGSGGYLSASTSMTNLPDLIDATGNDTGIRFADLNGDGYSDYALGHEGTAFAVYMNKADGTGWANASTSGTGEFFVDLSGNDTGERIVDINGDGIDDMVRRRPGDGFALISINKGNGVDWDETLVDVTSIYAPPQITGTSGADIGTRMSDINGDGLPDFIVSSPARGIHFQVNRGDGLSYQDTSTSGIPYFLCTTSIDIGTRLMDGNDDSLPDFVTSNASTKANYMSTGDPVDAMTMVTLPAGGTISVSYKGTRVDASLIRSQKTVTSDPKLGGTTMSKTYGYAYGKFQNQYQNRKFAGFARIDTNDSLNNITQTYFHQGNGNNISDPTELWDSAALGEYNDTEAKMYQPYRVEQFSPSFGAQYSQSTSRWDSKDLGGGRTLVFQGNNVNFAYDGLSTHKDSAITLDYSAVTGNLTQKTEWGQVTGSNNGIFTDNTNTDNRLTTYSYASSTATSSNPSLSVLSQQTLMDYLGNKVSEARIYYDNLAFGLATSGNPTRQEFWKTGTSYASSTKSYNSYGLITQSTDGLGATTTLLYDPYVLYASTSTNALGHITGYLYDYSSGKAKQTTDANGLIYQTTFDGFDRTLLEKQPDLTTPSTLVTRNSYTYTDTALAVAALKTSNLNAATSTITYAYQDGLNRTIQSRSVAQGSNTYAVKDSVFDSLGFLQKETLPYFASGTSLGAATSATALYVNYTYDALGRAIKVANAVGSTTNAYLNWKVTTTDADGKIKDAVKDAFGNLSTVVEHISTTTATTTYAWNGNNKLLSITDALSNVRNFTYDGLGRQLTAQDLHAPADGTFGTWTYVYDDTNNLTQQVDPKSQTVNFTYDSLSRPLTEDYTGSAGTEVTYAYDACSNGKTKLCAATTTDAVTNLTYNANGGVASEKKTIDNVAYTTAYNYDRLGNITDVTYPDTSAVKYGYDNFGFLTTISRKATSTYAFAINDVQYAPTGAISYKRFGNGVTSNYTYDPASLYRLTRILVIPKRLCPPYQSRNVLPDMMMS